MSATASSFKRNKILFFFLLGLIIVCALIYALREPLLPFFIGFVISYLLLPVVDWIDKRLPFKGKGNEVQRIIVIIVTFLIILALIGLLSFWELSSLINSLSTLLADAPTLISDGLKAVGSWLESLVRTLTPDQQTQAQDIFNNIGSSIGNWLRGVFMSGLRFIPSTITFVVGFLTLPFFLILFMANIHSLNRSFYSLFPTEVAYHVHNFIAILDNIFGRYIRAQIILALIMGFLVYISLFFIGVELAPSLALIAGVFQLIPAIGGALAAIVGIIVTLATAPSQVIWVTIAYMVINLAIGNILIAHIQGRAVNMDGAIVMILIVVGGYLGGIIGMILITPAVAIIFALYKYTLQELKRSQIEDA
jgi:predicted PurR-regulated permease PerM